MKTVFRINPLTDPRWPEFLQRHSRATVFHSPAWLSVLHTTYRYLPLAYTTSPPRAPLENGWVFCEVRSWLTGRRLVSLPFSDHCEPLAENPADLEDIAHALRDDRERQNWDYVEVRPQSLPRENISGFKLYQPFYLHKLDLRPTIHQIFSNLSQDSIQRKIRRAERDAIGYQEGTTKNLIDNFYTLMCHTRQRHGLPPQPRQWFSNLFSSLQDRAIIRVAVKDEKPVGALLTICFKKALVYKYSCGEPEHFKHGTMQLLLWRAIQDAKASGMEDLDFGRSDLGDDGLMLYKERWGAVRIQTGYFRCYSRDRARPSVFGNLRTKLKIPAFVPQGILAATGRLLYRHFG
jgi:Acetyltransferase (GNAT) domain